VGDAAVANAAAAQPRMGAVAGMAPFNVAKTPWDGSADAVSTVVDQSFIIPTLG